MYHASRSPIFSQVSQTESHSRRSPRYAQLSRALETFTFYRWFLTGGQRHLENLTRLASKSRRLKTGTCYSEMRI